MLMSHSFENKNFRVFLSRNLYIQICVKILGLDLGLDLGL